MGNVSYLGDQRPGALLFVTLRKPNGFRSPRPDFGMHSKVRGQHVEGRHQVVVQLVKRQIMNDRGTLKL